jgi:flagellar hook-length control protein FliK
MSATAAVEATATLAATPATTSREPVASVSEIGDAFDKVLSEQTAKALGEASLDGRDATTRSTKRTKATSAPTSPASLTTPKVASAAVVLVSAGAPPKTLSVDPKDINETPSAVAAPTDELTNSWRTAAPAIDAASAVTHSPADVNDPVAATTEACDTSSAPAMVAVTELSTLPSPLSKGATVGAKTEDVMSTDEKSPAESVAGIDSAPASDSAPSATLTTPAPTTSSAATAASAAIRAALPFVAGPTHSRGGAPRNEMNSKSADAATSITRPAVGASASTGKAFASPVVGPTVVSNARAAVAATNVSASSDTEAASLDVTSLASSISQATLGSDGSYTINVAMHPSDLGHVQAVVSLNGVDLHVAITPQTPTGHAALANAVETLKGELSRSGLNVNVSLRDPESRSGTRNENAQRPVQIGADESVTESEVTPVQESLNVSQIHLIL